MSASLTVSTTVEAPIVTVWDYWNKPEHIISWNSALNGRHSLRAARDYSEIEFLKRISYRLAGNRSASISFSGSNCNTVVTGTFDLEDANPADQQKDNWQSIMDQFKSYAESCYGCC